MQQYRDDAAQEWLNGLYSQTRCRWCLHPYMKLKARGLCSPCYRIAREFLNRYERASGSRDVALHSHKLQYVAEVAAMIDDAKQEGTKYGHIHTLTVRGLMLEEELRFVTEKLARAGRYFELDATSLAHVFSMSQRRLLFHLLAMMSRPAFRRARRMNAMAAVLSTADGELLALVQRAHAEVSARRQGNAGVQRQAVVSE